MSNWSSRIRIPALCDFFGFAAPPEVKRQSNERVLGAWMDNIPGASSLITLYRKGNETRVRLQFQDDSRSDCRVIIKRERDRTVIRDDPRDPGGFFGEQDFLIIDKDGNLEIHDEEGFIRRAKPTPMESPKPPPVKNPIRVWTSDIGTILRGRYVSTKADGGVVYVTLIGEDGRTVELPVSRLSVNDQNFLRRFRNP